MKIQAPKKLAVDNFQEDQKDSAGLIANSLNPFMDDVYNAVNGKLTITDNLNQKIKSFSVSVDASGIPESTIRFKSDVNGRTVGLTVIKTSGTLYVDSQPFIDFDDRNGVIYVNNIKGLSTSVKYTLTVLLYGE